MVIIIWTYGIYSHNFGEKFHHYGNDFLNYRKNSFFMAISIICVKYSSLKCALTSTWLEDSVARSGSKD